MGPRPGRGPEIKAPRGREPFRYSDIGDASTGEIGYGGGWWVGEPAVRIRISQGATFCGCPLRKKKEREEH
ncbi:hypothetical protein CesoFtcFv8_026461 [Champsocephalus esox]|uniref:Uncharacterized protein n=1 Tax=Champsocephalus esox TaxID=159716 RepID=A0AAN8GAK7_9TELE|nr:hypothetical protein CesoFtcFv8_026461 [Champsocephalus esox]